MVTHVRPSSTTLTNGHSRTPLFYPNKRAYMYTWYAIFTGLIFANGFPPCLLEGGKSDRYVSQQGGENRAVM